MSATTVLGGCAASSGAGAKAKHFLARLGVVSFKQGDLRSPGHYYLHQSKTCLLLICFMVVVLAIGEAQLLAAHHLSPGFRPLLRCTLESWFSKSFSSSLLIK